MPLQELNYDKPRNGIKEVLQKSDKESKTEQAQQAQCDINQIMRRANLTGIEPPEREGGLYGDFTSVEDYQESMNKIADAHSDFAKLPSHVRAKFDNNPEKLIEFISKPINEAQALEIGLINKDDLEAFRALRDHTEQTPNKTEVPENTDVASE